MDIEKTLKNAGLRTTRQRRVILELLLSCGSPLSHAEILSKIEEHLDRVTLYRTLASARTATGRKDVRETTRTSSASNADGCSASPARKCRA